MVEDDVPSAARELDGGYRVLDVLESGPERFGWGEVPVLSHRRVEQLCRARPQRETASVCTDIVEIDRSRDHRGKGIDMRSELGLSERAGFRHNLVHNSAQFWGYFGPGSGAPSSRAPTCVRRGISMIHN